MADSFVFRRLMLDVWMELQDPTMRADYLVAVCKYGLDGTLPDDPIIKALITGAIFSIDKTKKRLEASSRWWKNHKGNQYTKWDKKRNGAQEAQSNAVGVNGSEWKWMGVNGSEEKKYRSIYSNISSYEDIYSLYYKWGKGINPTKCDPLLDWLLARWVTLDDIKQGIVLYNSICRMRWSDGFRYTKNFDTWLKEYRKPTDDELEETLTTVIGMHKEKGKSDPKYKDSKRASVLWKELCDTFWKDRVNTIFKHEGSWPSVRFT